MKHLTAMALLALFAAGCATTKNKDAARAKALMSSGVDSLEHKDYSGALRSLLEATKYTPKDPDLWSNIGVAYVGKEDPAKAEEMFKKALSLNPKYNDAHLNLGVLYSQQKRYPEAERELREAAQDPAYFRLDQVAYQLASLYTALNRPLLAERQLKIAVRENPAYCPAWFRLGLMQKERGDYAEAAKSLSSSVTGTCFKNPQAHYEIASLYLKANEVPKAKKKLLEVIQLFPSSDWAKKSEATLNMIR